MLTAVTIVLAVLVAVLAYALYNQHRTYQINLEDVEAEAEHVNAGLHRDVSVALSKLATSEAYLTNLGWDYSKLRTVHAKLGEDYATLDELARGLATKTAEATVIIHDAQVVEDPLPAWDHTASLNPVTPVDDAVWTFDSVDGETGSWQVPLYRRGEQMALAGGAA